MGCPKARIATDQHLGAGDILPDVSPGACRETPYPRVPDISCAMAGSYALLKTFCRHANIESLDEHEHGSHLLKSPDGKYSIEFVECLASCGTGPSA